MNASGSLCLVDMGIVDVRRPFLSALLLTAGLAVAALVAASPLASWWQKRDEQRTAATFERENPALVALARLVPPEGLAECSPRPDRSVGVAWAAALCWEGDLTPQIATDLTVRELRRVGAVKLHRRCGTSPVGAVCRVDARLRGQAVAAYLGSGIEPGHPSKPHGSWAQIALDTEVLPQVPAAS